MSLSSGTRNVVGEGLSWLAAAVILIGGVVFFDDVKRVVAEVAGLPQPAQVAAQTTNPSRQQTLANVTPQARPAGNRVELRARPDGHFYTEARLNGRPVPVLVDTGASMVALPYEAAEKAGIYVSDRDFTMRARTANGVSRIAPVTISSIEINGIIIRNVRAAVAERGAMHITLLGMSFLGRLQRAEISRGRLVLEN